MNEYLRELRASTKLLSLVQELMMFYGDQVCFRTGKCTPMGMGRAKEARVRKILKGLAELGYPILPEQE